MTDFFRFPHTPHIAWLASGAPRDDKVLSPDEAAELLAGDVVIEEKLDGANLGLSVSPDGVLHAQNRGQYLPQPFHGQFSRLGPWLAAHEDRLFDAHGAHLIAFGEWCAARHSLDYVLLPDWWLVFDVYDRTTGQFWSTARRNEWAAQLGGYDRAQVTHRACRYAPVAGMGACQTQPVSPWSAGGPGHTA